MSRSTIPKDLASGLVVFLVALPLCLGVALASGAPLLSGILAGIIGGIVVGFISGSHTSVSGPAAGLTAVVAAQIASLGSFEAFLLAVFLAGVIQVGLGVARAGFIASFIPTSVIKGLLAAIGVLLILKQLPHLFGHDPDPEGDMAFLQPDQENTFSAIALMIQNMHTGAALIGLISLAFLVIWDRVKVLKYSSVPAPLLVVLLGVGLSFVFRQFGESFYVAESHRVTVPVGEGLFGFFSFLQLPDFSQWMKPAIYVAAITIAAVASLETLLNLEAVDKLDPQQRTSPPSRELLAQGVGNMFGGLVGALPITSVVVRSSVNINAGGKTKLSTIVHGGLLLICAAFLPFLLNEIPLSCLAAILIVTGTKLITPKLVRQMWESGRPQFFPFIVTVLTIVLTDLLLGIMVGLAVSVSFILSSNMRRPIRQYVEKHLGGDVVHIQLANQVSFLNRAALYQALDQVPSGGKVLLDAEQTDYIDPDVLDLIRDFTDTTGPARNIEVSLKGFRSKYQIVDQIQYVDYSTRDIQDSATPLQVLEILKDGNERFRTNRRLTRDLGQQVSATADGQHPLAVILSCIDSRAPAELIFDLGVGDVLSIRIAGNVSSTKVMASAEYGCLVAGAKLVLVMGHTRCGAVSAAVNLICESVSPALATGCQHIESIVSDIQSVMDFQLCQQAKTLLRGERESLINAVARRNVLQVVKTLRHESLTLDRLVREGRILILGAMYDVTTGSIEFLDSYGPV